MFPAIAVAMAFFFLAPAGYVDDAACATCHGEIARMYAQTGMARAFFRPRRDKVIEELDREFVHAPSKQIFQMTWRGDRLLFRRYQRDANGQIINLFEQPVDWILGSGQHSRVYLYQTPDGELYQLPLAWYSQTRSWGMSPGFDRPDHDGVTRRVRHECMFCHDAYPGVAPSSDGFWRSQAFPKELPEGTGCQRCHAPGAAHARDPKAPIVNPIRLPQPQRNDVCFQCHLLPSVAVQGARKFGRDVYSFKPGEALSDYVMTTDTTPKDRFEISMHGVRMMQSRCFRESGGRLECLTCHDPHRRLPPEERAAHYQRVCVGCHEQAHHATEDCISCHMQQRRTEDVVQVVMTDHRIGLPADSGKLLAPRAEQEPPVDDVELLHPMQGPEGELYRLLPLMRAGLDRDPKIFSAFRQALAAAKPASIEPLLDLANAHAARQQWTELEATAKTILARSPDHPLAISWLGIAAAGEHRDDEAIALFRRALALAPERTGLHVQLAMALHRTGKDGEAIAELERATALRPNLAGAWTMLRALYASRGDQARADEAAERVRAITIPRR